MTRAATAGGGERGWMMGGGIERERVSLFETLQRHRCKYGRDAAAAATAATRVTATTSSRRVVSGTHASLSRAILAYPPTDLRRCYDHSTDLTR
jgi:hypothetical protein